MLAHPGLADVGCAGVPVVAVVVRLASSLGRAGRARDARRRGRDTQRAAELVRVPAWVVGRAGLITTLPIHRDEAPTGRRWALGDADFVLLARRVRRAGLTGTLRVERVEARARG